jgi:O-antigen/teichoic acid export membrane protein
VSPEPGGTHHVGRWAAGLVIVALGVYFLGRNAGWWDSDWNLHNWWALFILIPAVGSFAGAWRAYVAAGRRFGAGSARPLVIGLLLVAVTVILLLELDWQNVWPILLVIVGVGLLLAGPLRHRRRRQGEG